MAAGGQPQLEAQGFEDGAQQLAVGLLVVDHQHAASVARGGERMGKADDPGTDDGDVVEVELAHAGTVARVSAARCSGVRRVRWGCR